MSKNYIKQHNAIIEARYDISALEKNIIYMLLAQLKDEDPPEKAYYDIDFGALEQRLDQKISIKSLVKAAEALVFRVYTIQKEDGGILYTSLISSVQNLPKHNIVQVGVSSMAKPYLLALKHNYTEFQLDMALRLKSKYAKRMYEMLSQHREKGTMEISVEELKYRLALKDPKTEKELYEPWSMFKEHVLTGPQEELSKHTDIRFTYTALKTGRKYTDLVFKIDHSKSP
jgi:plasmid replication initiation protein